MKKKIKIIQYCMSLDYKFERTYLVVTEYNVDKPIVSYSIKVPHWDFEELIDAFPNYPLNFN